MLIWGRPAIPKVRYSEGLVLGRPYYSWTDMKMHYKNMEYSQSNVLQIHSWGSRNKIPKSLYHSGVIEIPWYPGYFVK